jgi:hypothetical protein
LVLGTMLRKHAASPQAIPPFIHAIEFMADFNPGGAASRRVLAALAVLRLRRRNPVRRIQQNPVAFR